VELSKKGKMKKRVDPNGEGHAGKRMGKTTEKKVATAKGENEEKGGAKVPVWG